MITKEGGLRYAKLIHVSVDNGLTAQSNKVYIMEEQGDGRIDARQNAAMEMELAQTT